MARPKKTSVELASIEDANQAIRALLGAEVELEKQQGAMDLARAAATAKYEKAIDAQKTAIADLTLQLQNFYMARTGELEKAGRKSIQLAYGVIGRRLGQPVIKPLNRSWTWAAIAVQLRSIYRDRFFHPPAEPRPDKEKLRKDLTVDELHKVGLKVEQDENFFVETDRTTLGEGA